VKGPGQNNLANASKYSGFSVYILFGLKMWTIKGSLNGLFLARNMLNIASGFLAFAPNPYTVSVGKATNYP
jgi:hypothetical protein